MKQRRSTLFIIVLTAIMLTALQPTISEAEPAEVGVNSYGHFVSYAPQPLNAGGKELMLFDYDMVHYSKITSMSTAQQLKYLNDNKLSLNKFGKRQSTSGEVDAANPFNGAVYNKNSKKDFKVNYHFGSLLVGQTNGPNEGNLKTMYEKGDISFAFAYSVWLRYYDKNKVFSTENLSSIGEVTMFGEKKRWTGTAGNRWERVNYTSNDKLNISGSGAWKGWGGQNMAMTYYGSSYGGPVDTKLHNGVLVGKDSKGPKIKTVNLSWDMNWDWEYNPNGTVNSKWQGIDVIREEDIGKTVYIAVMFDEPVKFNQQYDTPQELANLKLRVQTLGRDGSSAMPLEADFLRYSPDANTSTPVMIFEYKIQDSNDVNSVRKDLYYTFSSIRITSTENYAIYSCLTDMAGNAFGEERGGQPQNYSVAVNNRRWNIRQGRWVPKSTEVDLEPFKIESATITRSSDVADQYLRRNDTVLITLNMNKLMDGYSSIPTITMNITDGNGQYIEPDFLSSSRTKASINSPLRSSLTYRYYLPWGWDKNLSAEGPVSIHSVSTEGGNVRDLSGYSLKVPETMPPVDKNYYLDFDKPVIDVDISRDEGVDNIVKIVANVEDASIQGRDALFSINTDLDSKEPLQYQISDSEEYGEIWNPVTGKSFSVSAPLIPLDAGKIKKAYVFIRLPDSDAQMTRVNANVSVTDAAGNIERKITEDRFTFDTRDPELELVRKYKKGSFSIMLNVRDFSSMSYRYAWLDGHDAPMPLSEADEWIEGGPIAREKQIEYLFADNGMTENQEYHRTLWVEVVDIFGNTTAQTVSYTYDNRYSVINVEEVIPEDTGAIIKDRNLSATVSLENVIEYAHAWIEWGPEFEEDGGATLISNAVNFYNEYNGNVFAGTKTVVESTTSTAVTFTLSEETQVWRNYNDNGSGNNGNSYGWDFAGQALPSEISGPIVLVICGRYNNGEDDKFTFEFIPFNTRYDIRNYEVQQIRFSTNGVDGNRINRVYKKANDPSGMFSLGYGLYYPHKPGEIALDAVNLSLPVTGAEGVYPTALNFIPLHDFAEAEFVLRDDPALGLESLKLTGEEGGTRVLLKKVVFDSNGSMEHTIFGEPSAGYDYSFKFMDAHVVASATAFLNKAEGESTQILESWYLTQDMLTLAETDTGTNTRLGPSVYKLENQNMQYLLDYTFTLPIDVSKITPNAYDDEGKLIRYEFWIEYAYQDHYNLLNESNILTMFAFENRLPELMIESVMADGVEFGGSHKAVPANLFIESEDEARIIDNTISAQRVMFKGDNPDLLLRADMPYNALNMLSNYSISAESVTNEWGELTSPITITPGHDYCVLFSTAEGLYSDGQFIRISRIDGQQAQCQDGSFIIDLGLLGVAGEILDGETLSIYYQLSNEAKNELSPIYRIDISRDEIPPVISLNVSETRITNNDVIVTIESVRDGRTVNEGQPDEHYIMDTPSDEILISVLAEYEDGQIVQPDNGAYVFKRNGSIKVIAVDKAGNEAISSYIISNIDTGAPVVTGSPVIGSENGCFLINAAIAGGDAVNAYISFDAEYAAHLSEGTDDDTRFPIADNEAYGIVVKKGISPEEADRLELLVYAKSGVPMSQAKLLVTDAAGNVGELILDLNLSGITPTITNSDKIYTYEGALTFNTAVRLIDPVGSEKGYAMSHEKLPIYADGPVVISYMDIFGRSYYEQITANIFGAAYAHDLTITPAGPTNGSVIIKIDTSDYSTAVLGGEDENHRTIIMSDNAEASYTIIPSGAMPPREFTIPITNIDRVTPKAYYTRVVNGEESFDENGISTVTGSVTYTILGFDKNSVVMEDDQAMTVTFNSAGEHVFRFTDAAGNSGELQVNENKTIFLAPMDLSISKFRLTYTMNGSGTGPAQLGYHYSDEDAPELMVTNQNISVLVQALNEAGDVIPATMELPAIPAEGIQYFINHSTLVFSKDGTASVSVKTASGSKKSVTITIPEGTIDKVPPKGSVDYVMLTGDEVLPGGVTFEKGTVKAYLITQEKDIEVSGQNVRQDTEGRYYIHFAENGNGVFYLTDIAGNTGTVVAGAYGIDNTPPRITTESWYSGVAAKPGTDDGTSGNSKEDVLSTKTNNSIRLFFIFNELIRNVDISVFSAEGGHEIPKADMGSYISYNHSANTLNIEFKQNCQAKISVFDIRGNETTLWRPEDGPLTVIDKEAPVYTASVPAVRDNKVSITYSFNEAVALANARTEYKSEHSIVFEKNGAYSLTFVDGVGNVATIITSIDQIDDESPAIFYALKIVPDDAGVLYSDNENTRLVATSGNVEIAIAAEDKNGVTIQVFNQNKPGSPLALIEPTINDGAEKVYTQALIVEENGLYRITATDDYGNTNTVFVRISFIDKEAPSILMENTKPISVVVGTKTAELSRLLMDGVSAKDDREGDLTSQIIVDISAVNLSEEGIYTAVYRVKDGLGNMATRSRKVSVSGSAINSLLVGGRSVAANDVFITTPGDIAITAPVGYTIYACEGYKTRGQMKYVSSLSGKLKAVNKGYYTILVQNGNRDAFIVYIYVY